MNNRFTCYLAAIVSFFAVTGCANVKDFQPPPTDNLPDSVLSVFQTEVPNAQNVVFKTVEKNWLYEADYRLDGHSAYGLLDSKKLLANYWRKSDTFPDSLKGMLSQLVIKDGVISGFWEPVFQYPYYKLYHSYFDFQGWKLVLTVTVNIDKDTGRRTYMFQLAPKWRFEVSAIRDEKKLPESIGAALAARNLKLQTSSILIDDDGKRTYTVYGTDSTFRTFTFTFNHDGKMVYAFDNVPVKYYSLGEFPASIQNFVKASPYKDFEFVEGNPFSDPEVSGHTIRLNTQKNSQAWYGTFDQNGGLITMYYNAIFN